jgi:hypothetical protein
LLLSIIRNNKTKTHFQHAGNHDEQLLDLQACQSAAKIRDENEIIKTLAAKWYFFDGSDDAPNATMLHLFDLFHVFHAFRMFTTASAR